MAQKTDCMKKALLLFGLLIESVCGFSQWGDPNCMGGGTPVKIIDSLSFEAPYTSHGILVVDTSFSDNLWQIGAVQKAGFPGAYSGTNALQTDTLNNYPINNESAAIIYTDSLNLGWDPHDFSLSFWHYYATDTLLDSCKLQMTVDSGKTWVDSFLGWNWPLIYYAGSLNNNGQQWYTKPIWWSGNSNGWQKESVCVFIPGVKGIQIPRGYGLRFLFISDSTETNKPGWMIDNIVLRTPQWGLGIDKISEDQSMIYPNPASQGIFTIDYPSNYVKGSVTVSDQYGRRVKTLPLEKQIDLSDLPKGVYLYTIFFDNTGQKFSGKLLYN
jgi:hypothetical protein